MRAGRDAHVRRFHLDAVRQLRQDDALGRVAEFTGQVRRGVKDQPDVADLDFFATAQRVRIVRLDADAIDIRAVDGLQVFEEKALVFDSERDVIARNSRRVEDDVVAGRTADGGGRFVKLVALDRTVGPVDVYAAVWHTDQLPATGVRTGWRHGVRLQARASWGARRYACR